MTTTANEKIKEVKNLIHESIRKLNIVLDYDTWGNGDFTEEYLIKLEEVLLQLHKIKRLI